MKLKINRFYPTANGGLCKIVARIEGARGPHSVLGITTTVNGHKACLSYTEEGIIEDSTAWRRGQHPHNIVSMEPVTLSSRG